MSEIPQDLRLAIDERNTFIKSLINNNGQLRIEDVEDLVKKTFTLGGNGLINQLRLCGDIPEIIPHDSSPEKIYSKFTDILLSEFFKRIGLNSNTIKERSGKADVIACLAGTDKCLVADAKAFRLSRTAKNQKDFKVNSVSTWKTSEKDSAIVVAPIYHLPTKSSQIYLQAINNGVCILTYTHLSYFLENKVNIKCFLSVLDHVERLLPNKNSNDYWEAINKLLVKDNSQWIREKLFAQYCLELAKKEGIKYYENLRKKILKMTKEQAIEELLKIKKIDNNIETINNVKII